MERADQLIGASNPHSAYLSRIKPGETSAPEEALPAGGPHGSRDNVKQGCLARPIGSDNAQYFPFLDPEIHVVKGVKAAEVFVNSLTFEDVNHHPAPDLSWFL